MGGCAFENEDSCNVINHPQTLVLVGKTGNGKSATGNSILGMPSFNSKRSSSGVTITSQVQATTLKDGQIINVIDTPGLFDSSLDIEFIGKEIVNCINMAKDGIHAFLVVTSIRNRFSDDERAAISSLLNFFGKKIYDYMIIVFTCGDDLEENESLEDFIRDSQALKETLGLCENRCVLFDNKTKNENKKLNQVNELFSLVQMVSIKNGGKPYTNEFFTEFKKCTRDPDQQEEQFREDQFKRMIELVELKLKDITLKLEQQLAEERDAREKAEKKAEAAQDKADELNSKMQENLEKAEKRNEKLLEKEEERRKEEAFWRRRGEDLRRQAEVFEKRTEDLQREREEERRKDKERWQQREEELCRQAREAEKRAEELRQEREEERQKEERRWEKEEERWRQREEDLRNQAGNGCVIL